MRGKWIVLIVAGINLFTAFDRLAAAELAPAKTKPTHIAVFKNGLGFVTRSGEVQVQNGAAELEALPAAALGALWFSTENPAHRITEITSVRREQKIATPALNL